VTERDNSGSEVRRKLDEPEPLAQPSPSVGQSADLAATRTTLHSPAARRAPLPTIRGALPIRVKIGTNAAARELTETAQIGRGANCTIRIDDDGVSRMHAEIFRTGNQWFARDLGSSNGTYLDGKRIEQAPLPARCTLRLGAGGPPIELSYAAPPPRSLEQVAAHYFDKDPTTPAGDHTMMIRRAYSTVRRQQSRRYGSAIAGALGLLLVAVCVGIYQYFQLQRTRALAEQLFYNMKTVELQLERLEVQVQADAAHRGQVQEGRAQLAEMTTQYDALLGELGVLGKKLPPEDRLIIRVARLFGECELGMPKGFVEEVKRYIDVWRGDQRLANAVRRAREQNLTSVITRNMIRHHLPPQFFYVALQESDFRPQAVGPETRLGIAKGIWQLMPATADQYGLHTGPLLEVPQFDPDDQRFDAPAATQAAASYLGDLYHGQAQASGLLVLASYNWGATRVKKRILAMKENPRDRNFWALLARTDIPAETRDYVFLIFAAAVIGEDPKLFGFEFDKPLAHL